MSKERPLCPVCQIPTESAGHRNNKIRWRCPQCKKYIKSDRSVGRPRTYKNHAEKIREYRKRKKLKPAKENPMTTTKDKTTESRSPLRLTSKQQRLLDELLEASEGSTTTWIECGADEWRSAQALQRKGLIEIVSERSDVIGTFEVKLTNKAIGENQ